MTKVFCIGLGRTGTTTFQDCMRTLGYRHRGWHGADLGLMSILDVRSIIPIIEQFDSFDDYPFPLIYPQLLTHYPDAKFILTHRKSAEIWADSIIKESNRKQYNDSDNIWYDGQLNQKNRYSYLVEKYNSHLMSATEFFSGSTNFLTLCWECGDGWEKLCSFLGQPVPQISIPHRNKGHRVYGPELIDYLLKQNSYNKILLLLHEQQDDTLRQYTLDKLASRATTEQYQTNPLARKIIQNLQKICSSLITNKS